MDSVEQFAKEVIKFRDWVIHGKDTDVEVVQNALLHITRLYLAGFELSSYSAIEHDEQTDGERVSDEEMQAVLIALKRLPLDFYAVVDPIINDHLPEARSIGSLFDDIADIYRDVVSGLKTFEAGHRNTAIWNWEFSHRVHWGRHATEAIRVLHAWLN